MNLTGRPMYKKSRPVKDKEVYDQYARDHYWCEFCGVSATQAPFKDDCGGVGLSRHHIIKPGRSDEPTNLIVACQRDHSLCEGLLIRDARTGLLFPKLTLGIVLSVKKLRSPLLFNFGRLQELYGCNLPDFEPVPQFLLDEWRGSYATQSVNGARKNGVAL